MKYLLMIYADEAGMAAAQPAESVQILGAYNAYTKAMVDAGVMLGGERLRPTTTATTVRLRNGKSEVLDGPYAETREQLGGYFMIDVADLDTALTWASRCPGAAHGTMEVRPIWPMEDYRV